MHARTFHRLFCQTTLFFLSAEVQYFRVEFFISLAHIPTHFVNGNDMFYSNGPTARFFLREKRRVTCARPRPRNMGSARVRVK